MGLLSKRVNKGAQSRELQTPTVTVTRSKRLSTRRRCGFKTSPSIYTSMMTWPSNGARFSEPFAQPT
jgi:hypothetical protein